MPSRARVNWLSRAEELRLFGVGEELRLGTTTRFWSPSTGMPHAVPFRLSGCWSAC